MTMGSCPVAFRVGVKGFAAENLNFFVHPRVIKRI